MLAKRYNFTDREKYWQERWEEEGIFKFNQREKGPIYSIDTPPPTVSGSIHIGHVYSYTQAEVVARFWRMKGYRVFYPFGFDDNGLPTERLVEREQGIRANDLGREEFNQLCLELTDRYEKDFKMLWQSLGFSVDWDLEYSTIDQNSRAISQKSFIELYHRGYIYREKTPVLWCGNCQTSIAQAEVETKEKKTIFNYIKFKTDTRKEFTIATTRPELLPACVAVFINPDDQENASLIGGEAILPLFERRVPILADSQVEKDMGSGIVMCCTFGDQQDIDWWKQYDLDLREIIGRDGRMKSTIERYGGQTLLKTRQMIIKDLKEEGYLLKKEELIHHVAEHDRCNTEVEFLSSDQWYIRIMDRKGDLLTAGNQINWHPAYMKQRYLQWVENLQWDWCISRQRYFGVPFPLWYCKKCGEVLLADEKELPINPLKDKPTGICQCGSKEFAAESDVMDTWATSSLTPLINAGWQGEKQSEYPILPMSLRPQAHDIIRTWAFYTIVKSLYHNEQLPWQDIMISGFVLAGKGEKISKSKNNASNTPQNLIKKYSADVIRLWAASANLGADIVFAEEELKNKQRLPIKLWNAARFTLSHLQDFAISQGLKQGLQREAMDQWVLAKLRKTHQEMTDYLERYELNQAMMVLDSFFWNDFCDNYLEIIKERLYKSEIRGREARLSAQDTLYRVLLNILKMYAIFTPHICEEIFQNYYFQQEQIKSIHLLPWDSYLDIEGKEGLLALGETFIKILGEVRKFKTARGLSLGTELQKIIIRCSDSQFHLLKETQADLKAVTRASMIDLQAGSSDSSPDLEIII